jgi:ribonuclease J
MVHRTINRLFQRGADVLYDPIEQVHVSGHASQDEQKRMIELVRPQYFIPIHGELRHLHAHARLARQVGIDAQNILVIENGYPVEFDEGEARIAERVPGGYVYIDGSGVGDIGPSVLRERELLGRDGFMMAIIHRDPESGRLLDTPDIVTRGFIYQQQAEDVLEGSTQTVVRIVEANGHSSQEAIRDKIEKSLSEYLYSETKRRPMIMAIVRDV